MTASKALIFRARQIYKELHHLGRDYPDPSYNFHARLRGCFRATAASGAGANDADLEKAIKKAEFVKSEVEALIFLKKYRQMRERYGAGFQRQE